MNNKLFKTAVVLVTIVVVLCSFASAATINSLSCSETKDSISMGVDFADDATKGMYIAYAAQKVGAGTEGAEIVDGESFLLGPIVTVFQAEGEFLTMTTHGEAIDPELVTEEYDHIVLKAGDNGAESTTADAEAAEIPVPATKHTITVINGEETVALDVANDGTVTVPDTLVFNKESEAELVFTLYSFVVSDEEDADEYVITDGKATVPVDATVYAKYQTAYKIGDVDKDEEITLSDYGAVKRVATGKSDRVGVSKEVVTGSGVLVGDVDFDGEITLSDYGAVKRVATGKSDRVGVNNIRTYINK